MAITKRFSPMQFKIFLSIILLPGILPIVHTQNFLPNPGFEEANSCHKYQEECCPMGWWSTGPKLVKYHRYLKPGQVSRAYAGKAHMSLLLYDRARDFDRKFIQAPLLCPLIAGQEYVFSAYIKTDYFRIARLGIAFNDSLFFAKSNKALQQTEPQLLLQVPPTLPADQWVRLEGRFIAKGSEQFIIVGNFESDEETDLSVINPKALKKRLRGYVPAKKVKYEIDELSLLPAQPQSSCDFNKNLELIRQRHHRHSPPPKEVIPPEVIASPAVIELPPPLLDSVPAKPEVKLQKGQTIILKNVNFEFGTAVLLTPSFEELKVIAKTLILHPELQILIKGHTDHIGNANHNWTLSRERAKTVHAFLVRQGIDRKRMTYKGYGETQPIASNEKEEGRQTNRRVEIEVIE